jgi:hypothetical protein
MSRAAKELIALFLILWLPLMSGNAVARAMLMSADSIQQTATAECPEHAGLHTQSDSRCAQCEFCQMACAAYLPPACLTFMQESIARDTYPPFLGELHTLTLPQFDPPPIAA